MSLTAADKFEIQELACRYAVAMDEQNLDAWMETWAPDGVWDGRLGLYEGTERLRQLIPDLGDKIKGKRHVMTNFVIDGSGDSATQTCYMIIVEGCAPVVATVVYKDVLKKLDGKWRFARRTVKLDATTHG
jgi:hypothetical protein